MLLEIFIKGKNLKISVRAEKFLCLRFINGGTGGMMKGMKVYFQNTIIAAVPSKLSLENKKKLNSILEKESYLNQKKVAKIIKDEFGVVYSKSQQPVVLRELGFRYSKPHQFYSKRPENAEELLKKTYLK
jgi:hypothetical protein